jgi:hypothetical protein
MRVALVESVLSGFETGPHHEIKDKFTVVLNSYYAPDPAGAKPERPTGVHDLLAGLNLPIYITTNYDDLMERALERRGVHPTVEYCRWNPDLEKRPRTLNSAKRPTSEEPLVYHFHGIYTDPDTMVLTENDYLRFISHSSTVGLEPMIPTVIQDAIAGTALLFLGYGLQDLNFRVVFSKLQQNLTANKHVAVQLAPLANLAGEDAALRQETAKKFLYEHYNNSDIKPIWADCQVFVSRLAKAVGG